MPKTLISTSVSAPAFYGLNSQRKADVLPFQWATKLENWVIDDSGRVSARKGYQKTHATAITSSPDINALHEYIDASGSLLQIFAAGNALYKIVGSTVTDISGSITTPTADNWKFVNFNGKVVGFQDSHAPVVLATVSGTFTDITIASGSASSNEVMSAFGRLWILDGTDLKYCASLDETHWTTGAGLFDLSTVWPAGMDTPVALAEFNGYLIVFGKQSIIIYNNPWVPTGTGAIDATNMSLEESIIGIGCVARDSVQSLGKDIVFLSNQGLRALSRVIQEKSMPLKDISKNVNDELNLYVNNETLSDIKSAYSKKDGFYILSLPTANKSYYFDMRVLLKDGTFKVTTWATSYKSFCVTSSNTMYVGTAGFVGTYTGYLDGVESDGSNGSTYVATYESGWNDMSTAERDLSYKTKIPKK